MWVKEIPPSAQVLAKSCSRIKKEDYLEMVISKGLTQFTKNTITDPIKFREHIVQVREQKYAFSIEELALGVFSVASPIRNYTGRVVAAVSIAGSMEGFQDYKINEYRAKRYGSLKRNI